MGAEMRKIDIQPKWKTVEFSRSQIIKAGKTIRSFDPSKEETDEAIRVIDNWRVAHAFPLHVIYIHLRRMAHQSQKNIIVAERLKRLESITNKLKKEQSMNLWTMQDLGGCRLIVPSIEDVYEFAYNYEKSRKRHIKKEEYDYIKNPKSSGYRSLHVVYKYQSDHVDTYNKNMLIEIQFRTHIQHIWATAVETMGLFTQEAIKSGQGSDDVKRFFVLTSALLAKKENQPKWSDLWSKTKNKPRNELIARMSVNRLKGYYRKVFETATEKESTLLLFTVTDIVGRTCGWGMEPLYKAHLQDAFQRVQMDMQHENGFATFVMDELNAETIKQIKSACHDFTLHGDFVHYENLYQGVLTENSLYSPGIQLADYAAGVMNGYLHRRLLNPNGYEFAFDMYAEYLEPKMRKHSNGTIVGYGVIDIPKKTPFRKQLEDVFQEAEQPSLVFF